MTLVLSPTTLALVIAGLTGCSSPKTTSISYSELNDGAQALLSQAAQARQLNGLCKHHATTETQVSYQQWLTDNWRLVVGADAFYRLALSRETVTVNDTQLSLTAKSFWRQATTNMDSRRPSTEVTLWCSETQEVLLTKQVLSPAVQKEMLAYSDVHPSAPEIGAIVPTLAAALIGNPEPGRSFYKVEKLMKTDECQAKPVYITMESRWPDERYLYLCQKKSLVIECQWGHCQARR